MQNQNQINLLLKIETQSSTVINFNDDSIKNKIDSSLIQFKIKIFSY